MNRYLHFNSVFKYCTYLLCLLFQQSIQLVRYSLAYPHIFVIQRGVERICKSLIIELTYCSRKFVLGLVAKSKLIVWQTELSFGNCVHSYRESHRIFLAFFFFLNETAFYNRWPLFTRGLFGLGFYVGPFVRNSFNVLTIK